MVCGVEPAPPKPVEVNPGSIFHRAKEIGWFRALEHPTLAKLLERFVENLPPHNGFPKNGESHGRFGVGVWSKLKNRLGVRHDGHLITATHVGPNFPRICARGVIFLPLGLCECLKEAV